MRGYYRDELEDYDEYEDDGEEEDEEEEDPKPTKEELDYLELRQKLKEAKRKQMKRENGSSLGNRPETKNKLPTDNFGSFFGPAKPVIAQRVIQESKSFIENRHLAAKVSNSQQTITKSSTSATAGSKTAVRNPVPKVANQLKVKNQKLRDTRDYSFLLSDDAEHLAPANQSSVRSRLTSPSETRYTQVPPKSKQPLGNGERHLNESKQPLGNGERHLNDDHEQRKQMIGHLHPQFGSSKLSSASKSSSALADPRKQLGSKNGVRPGRPPVPKGMASNMPTASLQKKTPIPGSKSSLPTLHKQPSSKLQSSITKQQQLEQRKPQQQLEQRKLQQLLDKRKPPQHLEQRMQQKFPDQRRPQQHPDQRRPQQHPDQRRPQQHPDQRRPQQHLDQRMPHQHPDHRRPQQHPDQRRPQQHPEQRRPQQHPEQRRPQQHPEQRRPQQHPEQRRPQQHPEQRRPQQHLERQEPSKIRMAPKHPAVTSRPQINKPLNPNPSRTMEDRRPKKKPARYFSDDDDDDGGAIAMIRKMFGYNPNKYAGRDEDDSDMEANFDDILREEKRSAKIARREDEEQLLLIEQEEEQERRAALARRKRKLGQQ